MRHHILPVACASLALAAACRAPTPSQRPRITPPATVIAPAASLPSGRAAFVVLGYDETLVIPIEPAREAQTLPGHWVGALPGSPTAAWGLVRLDLRMGDGEPEHPSLPVCPSGVRFDTCSLDVEPDGSPTLATGSGPLLAKAEVVRGEAPRWSFVDPRNQEPCACVVVHGISTDDVPMDPRDPAVIEAMEDTSTTTTPRNTSRIASTSPIPSSSPPPTSAASSIATASTTKRSATSCT